MEGHSGAKNGRNALSRFPCMPLHSHSAPTVAPTGLTLCRFDRKVGQVRTRWRGTGVYIDVVIHSGSSEVG